MQLSLNRHTAGRGLPLPEFVELSRHSGFDAADVDLSYAVEHGAAALADLYQRNNQTYGGCGIPFDWRAAEVGDISLLQEQATIAAKLGIDTCSTHILPSSDLPFHQNWHFHAQRLLPIAKVLSEHGLRLGLEFVSPYHLRRKWKHEFIFTPMAMLELAGDVGPNCGLLVDSFHLHAAGEPMSVINSIPAEKIVLVHVNDAPAGPLHTLEDGKRLLPGAGVIDLHGFFAGLRTVGYAGSVAVEIFSDELKALPPDESARRAATAGRAVMAAAGITV
jgi:sugar phosphate isomerase/epimerase